MKNQFFTHAATAALTVATFSTTVRAEDWPYFRGPKFDGVSTETKWNSKWDGDPKQAWKASVGIGAASFAVKGNKVITSGNKEDKDIVWCFDIDSGDVLWKREIACEFDKRMYEGGTAATPTIDGNEVYNLSYDGQLQCLNLSDGKVKWSKHLVDDYKGKLSRWKYAGSPLVQGNLLILDCGGDGNSTLALDKKTGKKVWGSGNENAGYASPIPFQQGGVPAVLVFKGKSMVAHAVKDGKRLWDIPWETSYDVNASSPIVLGKDRMLISSGYGGGRAVLFDISGKKPKELWRNDDIKTKMSSCVVVGDHVFAVCGDSSGKLICVSLKDGKTVWSEKGFGFGSLATAGGKLIVLGDKGNMVIAEASGAGYKPISEAQVLPKRCWVNPVIAHGRILCKNNKGKMVCLDVRS